MTEISEFEKQLNPGNSFEEQIGDLTFLMARWMGEKGNKNFYDDWDAWVRCLPKDLLDLNLLTDVEHKYQWSLNPRNDHLPNYHYLAKASVIFAAAAQRAHNRADSSAAWNLLIKTRQLWDKVEVIETVLYMLKEQAGKGARALANGDVPGQRVRYQIIMLLHRSCVHQNSPVLFESVESAIDRIDSDIAKFIDKNKLQISWVNLVISVNKWIKDHPAFRAEMSPFFAIGVIPT